MNDNRKYRYGLDSSGHRKEFKVIYDWIKPNSRVIDLGCGDGSLLALLKHKNVIGEGRDISKSAVAATRKKVIRATVGRIDQKLPYKDRKFDYAVCNVTLQMVMYPEVLLSEMKRISKRQIITFPNFGFLLNRLELLVYGRMPQFMLSGYKWYSTGHIHQLGIPDFIRYCSANHTRIIDHKYMYPRPLTIIPSILRNILPDFCVTIALFQTGEK